MDSCEIEWVKSQVATIGRNYAKSDSKVANQGRTLLGAWMGRGGCVGINKIYPVQNKAVPGIESVA